MVQHNDIKRRRLDNSGDLENQRLQIGLQDMLLEDLRQRLDTSERRRLELEERLSGRST